jgi:hypothetical protein
MTVGEAVSTLRDITIIVGLVLSGWKARDWFQPVFDFFKNANQFMVDMRRDMQTLLTNHLSHIESDLRHMTGRTSDYVKPLETEGDDAIR